MALCDRGDRAHFGLLSKVGPVSPIPKLDSFRIDEFSLAIGELKAVGTTSQPGVSLCVADILPPTV